MNAPLQLQLPTRLHALPEAFYRKVNPQPLNNPYLVAFSPSMAELLNIPEDRFETPALIEQLSGNLIQKDNQALAMIYAGHQFGHYVPQLGDGRAMLLGELNDSNRETWEVQLKGAGLTPFSRMGDGRAVLRSTIREFLCSEAMAGLKIPTTRALCITASQDPVYREQQETAAVLTRVSRSHVRFGSFELFFYRQQYQELKILADFVITHFYPECNEAENPYLELLSKVMEKTAALIARWQLVGFTHGVLNSDNMSIIGDTIDYGPYGFLDHYEAAFVCNHTDQQGRYAFEQQPRAGLFNLTCLAQALLPLIDDEDGQNSAELAKTVLQQFQPEYEALYCQGMAAKLGFRDFKEGDQDLFSRLFEIMEGQVDFTRFFRALSEIDNSKGSADVVGDMFIDRNQFDRWYTDYASRLSQDKTEATDRHKSMRSVNPRYILRNYMAQNAIVKAQAGDFEEVMQLVKLLQTPYDDQPDLDYYAEPPPDWAKHLDLSCSS